MWKMEGENTMKRKLEVEQKEEVCERERRRGGRGLFLQINTR